METDHVSAVEKFGKACPNPSSFMGALHIILTAKNYIEGVRNTIIAGGDNCSRVMLAGASLGAKFGIDAIPVEWIEKTNNHVEIL